MNFTYCPAWFNLKSLYLGCFCCGVFVCFLKRKRNDDKQKWYEFSETEKGGGGSGSVFSLRSSSITWSGFRSLPGAQAKNGTLRGSSTSSSITWSGFRSLPKLVATPSQETSSRYFQSKKIHLLSNTVPKTCSRRRENSQAIRQMLYQL